MASVGTIDRWKQRVGEATWNRRMEWLARLGYLMKGVIYVVLGVLAFEAAWNATQAPDGTREAVLELGDEPFGTFLLWLTALGLFGYAAYRIVQAVLDPEGVGRDGKGIAKRVGLFASGLVHGSLAVWTLSLVTGWFGGGGGGGGGGGEQGLTARVMAEPFGRWAVAAAGLGVILAGFAQLKRAIKDEVFKDVREPDLPPTTRRWVHRLGRFGFAARFVTFSLIGVFLVQAAVQYDPSQAGGLGEALAFIAAQPWGQVLLGLIAVGMIGYALYCFVKARYLQLGRAV